MTSVINCASVTLNTHSVLLCPHRDRERGERGREREREGERHQREREREREGEREKRERLGVCE